jgi:hypothetical protein
MLLELCKMLTKYVHFWVFVKESHFPFFKILLTEVESESRPPSFGVFQVPCFSFKSSKIQFIWWILSLLSHSSHSYRDVMVCWTEFMMKHCGRIMNILICFTLHDPRQRIYFRWCHLDWTWTWAWLIDKLQTQTLSLSEKKWFEMMKPAEIDRHCLRSRNIVSEIRRKATTDIL